MHIHMLILAGVDNRYPLIRDTVRLAGQAFDSVHIIDTGSTDDTPRAVEGSTNAEYHELRGWDNDWNLAYMSAASHVPDGDWFVFFDSDERPTQMMLDQMRETISTREAERINQICIPNFFHCGGQLPKKTYDAELATMPETGTPMKAVNDRKLWTKSIIVKKLPDTWAHNTGAHCGFRQFDERRAYARLPYAHLKTPSQIAASFVLCSWRNIEHNGVPSDSYEYRQHVEVQRVTGIYTSDQLWAVIAADALPSEVSDMWRSWQHSKIHNCRHAYTWAFEHRFNIDLSVGQCGKPCCLLGGVQL